MQYIIQYIQIYLLYGSIFSACYASNNSSIAESDDDRYGTNIADGLDTKKIDVEDDFEKTLDSLSKEEAVEVCIAAADRNSSCKEFALQQDSVEECFEVLADCDEESLDFLNYSSCCRADFGSAGSCSITPQKYFDCIDSFEKSRACEKTGKVIITPDECRAVVQECQILSDNFGRLPLPIPDCSSTGDQRGAVEHDKDIYGADRCFPVPDRMVVLGDSVTMCLNYASDEIEQCECYWKNLASYIKNNYAPEIVSEGRYPDPGIIRGNIRDVAQDAQTILGGSGHILVWISCIAWDLLDLRAGYIGPEREQTDVFDGTIEEAVDIWRNDWQKLFDYFSDPLRFPDGATFMISTIYSPTDQCPESENPTSLTSFSTLSSEEEQAIQYANQKLLIDAAEEREDTVTVDMYPDFLGHGHNYQQKNCPYYSPDKTYWMADQVHANGIGYTHMGNKWKRAVDRMYKENCQK